MIHPEHLTHRGWLMDFDLKPVPSRAFDWSATHPNYDASYEGEEDGWIGSHEVLYAATQRELMAAIDEWIAFEEEEQGA